MSCVSLGALTAELSELLQSHANRDKVLCLASYALKLCGAAAGREAPLRAAARLAAARASARLLDDAALLRAALAYGLGRQEGPVWGSLGVAYHVFYAAYLQAEKALWLWDAGAAPPPPPRAARWAHTGHKLCWVMFTTIAFIRSIRELHLASRSPSLQRAARVQLASLSSTKLLLDVAHTVGWLPRGWLWGGRLGGAAAGALATASAALALVVHYRAKALKGKDK